MTGRELIGQICESMDNLDNNIKIQILHRSEDDQVDYKQNVGRYYFINGKLLIENGSISNKIHNP